jgi:hypothetical protein
MGEGGSNLGERGLGIGVIDSSEGGHMVRGRGE